MARTQCRHRLLQILDYDPMGYTVGCLGCNLSFHLPEPNAEEFFYPFTHTSPEGKEKDISILVHSSILKV